MVRCSDNWKKHEMNRQISFLVLLFLFPSAECVWSQPNIVLFFVDDLGWGDVGYRNPKFHTPNIDQLREEGMDFRRAYISTPTCSPSRASLLTGKESVRLQLVRHIPHEDEYGRNSKKYHLWPTDPAQMPSMNWLPLEETTYAERLGELGYYNIFIGKWHLGHEPFYPDKQGFDETFGVSNFGHPKSYYPAYFKEPNPLNKMSDGNYLTDVLTDRAVEFVNDYKGASPFMLSFYYYNVHGPHVGRRDWLQRYREEGLEGRIANYAAMLSTLDESIGRVRSALEANDLAENTVVIFLSDQGGYFSNAPLRGGKRGGFSLCEGGARVPFIVHYPKLVEANTACDVPVQSIDLFPTLIELASRKKCRNKSINGKSLLPLLLGKKMGTRNLFFYRSYEDQYAAIMHGDWKLIKYRSDAYEMFNLDRDPEETNNLIGSVLRQEHRLKKRLAKWEADVAEDWTYE